VLHGTFVERRGSVARSQTGGRAAVFHLPVWAFQVEYVCHWEDPAREALARPVPRLDRVYVTGFEMRHPAYFGDPGLIFTEKRVRLEPGTPALVVGCSRSLEEAKAYIEPHLLTIIDRRVDVTGLELSCALRDVRLWGIPYFDDGDALRDGILGLKIPAAAVDELGTIRARLGAGR
jgi:hypothetical protein